jgi:hypothetical protein
MSFSSKDPMGNDFGSFINFTTCVTIAETQDFCTLIDPRDKIIVGFPNEEECWEFATELIGVKSITVMKKLGWKVVNSSIIIEK